MTRAEEKRRPKGTALSAHSREYRVLVQTRADLAASVGGSPTPTQVLMIEAASQLKVRMYQADCAIEAGRAMDGSETKHYVSLTNSLARILHRLGVDTAARAKPAVRSLADIIAADRARQDGAA